MKTLVNLTLIISHFLTSIMTAQTVNGIATYKSQRKVDVELDSTQMNDEMRSQVMAMLKKQFEKEYTLDFNNDISVYKEVENLEKPRVSSGGMEIVVASAGGSDILYKNSKENRFANQNDLFGKLFLINDSLDNLNWQLEKETKNIGEYGGLPGLILEVSDGSETF